MTGRQLAELKRRLLAAIKRYPLLSKALSEFSLAHNNSIDMSYLDGVGFNSTIFPYKGALIYRFSDESSPLRNKPYEFFFAIS